MQVVPTINDGFWFEQSKVFVNSAIECRDSAAAKIQTFCVWLWGIYTGSTAIGFGLAKQNLSCAELIIIASGSCLLIATYFLSIWVQIPVLAEFDPKAPTKIIEFYSLKLHTKQKRLLLTIGTGAVALLACSIGLLTAATASPAKRVLSTAFSIYGTNKFVTVCFQSEVQTDVTLSLIASDSVSKARVRTVDNKACATFPLSRRSAAFISAEWEQAGLTNMVSKPILE